jgi:hypothetical protein
MSYSTFEIRMALIQLGQKRGAEYPLCVVRDVIEAFKADVDHPVKDAVKACIAEKRESYVTAVVVDVAFKEKPRSERVYATKEQLEELKHKFDIDMRGLKAHVARAIGLKRPYRLCEYLSGRIFMSVELYNEILEQIPKSIQQIIIERKNKQVAA